MGTQAEPLSFATKPIGAAGNLGVQVGVHVARGLVA